MKSLIEVIKKSLKNKLIESMFKTSISITIIAAKKALESLYGCDKYAKENICWKEHCIKVSHKHAP